MKYFMPPHYTKLGNIRFVVEMCLKTLVMKLKLTPDLSHTVELESWTVLSLIGVLNNLCFLGNRGEGPWYSVFIRWLFVRLKEEAGK